MVLKLLPGEEETFIHLLGDKTAKFIIILCE